MLSGEGGLGLPARRRGTRERAGESSPSCLTEGESPAIAQQVKVDWCTATWLPEPDEILHLNIHDLLLELIGDVLGTDCSPKFGYDHAIKFHKLSYGSLQYVARLDYGGDRHYGRCRLDICGTGCSVVKNWKLFFERLSNCNESRLTRVDLALDDILGIHGVEEARNWYLAGEFNAGGRPPRHSTPGDWYNPAYEAGKGERKGRTFEVGRRENGKMLRSYEKGRQLGDSASNWTRFEVELRNKDRDLPLDILINTDRYFAGAYKCLERLISESPSQRIPTHQIEGKISLNRLKSHARTSYGRLIGVLRMNLSPSEIIEELSRPGLPRRLEKPVLSGFSTAPPPSGAHQIGVDNYGHSIN